ncbi:MAG: hypothetical protein ABFS14_10010, partial [Gemmatimonadota bacterium]
TRRSDLRSQGTGTLVDTPTTWRIWVRVRPNRYLRAVAFVALAISSAGCGIGGPVVPPVLFDTSTSSDSLDYPESVASRNGSAAKDVIRGYDTATAQTRTLVTTHSGTYILWFSRPRVSFLFAYEGREQQSQPAWVYMVFQVREPVFPDSPDLGVNCSSWSVKEVAPVSYKLDPGPIYDARYYVYRFSVQDFLNFLRCEEAEVTVGHLRVDMNGEKLVRLQALAGWLSPGGQDGASSGG